MPAVQPDCALPSLELNVTPPANFYHSDQEVLEARQNRFMREEAVATWFNVTLAARLASEIPGSAEEQQLTGLGLDLTRIQVEVRDGTEGSPWNPPKPEFRVAMRLARPIFPGVEGPRLEIAARGGISGDGLESIDLSVCGPALDQWDRGANQPGEWVLRHREKAAQTESRPALPAEVKAALEKTITKCREIAAQVYAAAAARLPAKESPAEDR